MAKVASDKTDLESINETLQIVSDAILTLKQEIKELREVVKELEERQAKFEADLQIIAPGSSLLPREIREGVEVGKLYTAVVQGVIMGAVASNPAMLTRGDALNNKQFGSRIIDRAIDFGDAAVEAFKARLG